MKWSHKARAIKFYQFFFTRVQYLLPWHLPKVISGGGSTEKLADIVNEAGIKKLLLVVDPNVAKLGLPEPLLKALDNKGIKTVIYDNIKPNPEDTSVEEARSIYQNEGCGGIIAFGGGSSMDCAKAAGARIARPKRTVEQLGGTFKVFKKLPPLYAIPTTAGTGSETTIAAVITDSKTRHKYAINDLSLIPIYAVLDPNLTVGLPPHITATTGLDALTHAVEAYTNRYTPAYAADFAVKAVKLIFENLETAYNDGKNIEARNNMLLASYYGGAAFTRAGVGNVHAIAHTLGGLYGVAHGLANSVILPIVLEDYGKAAYKKLARLADAVGITGESEEVKAKAFIAAIRGMNDRMNIPRTIEVIKDEDIPRMISWAMKEANPVYPVPVVWGPEQFAATIDHIRGKQA